MIDAPRIAQTIAQQTAIIRLTIPRAEMMTAFGPAVGELMATLAAQGIAPTGPVFAHHLKMTPGIFDFEVGVAVAAPVTATGRVKPSVWPAMKVVRTVYHGPYEGLPDAWGEFTEWIAANGHTPAEDLWECYVTGPHSSADSAMWQTELNRPLTQ